MVQNLGLPTETLLTTSHRIVFSLKSSDIEMRSLDFFQQIESVKKNFPQDRVESFVFKELSLSEQIQIASQTSVFITLCGGGAVTAMFLPKGAVVIAYYGQDGVENNILTGKPALLDWDLLNSMSHLRVHWMPRNTMDGPLDKKTLVLLIQHELEIMSVSPELVLLSQRSPHGVTI
jgi:hypothetical protein